MANFSFPKKIILKIGNATSASKLKVILRQKSWMKKSRLQATGLNYESAKRPKRFLNFLPPPISLGLSWREMTCDGDILFSERSPTKAPTPVPTQSFSPTAFDPQDGLSSFHQILLQEPSQLAVLFLVKFQLNQDLGFAYMVLLAFWVVTISIRRICNQNCQKLAWAILASDLKHCKDNRCSSKRSQLNTYSFKALAYSL